MSHMTDEQLLSAVVQHYGNSDFYRSLATYLNMKNCFTVRQREVLDEKVELIESNKEKMRLINSLLLIQRDERLESLKSFLYRRKFLTDKQIRLLKRIGFELTKQGTYRIR
jgi:hypothetical protein